jgi:hypothetical protein
MRLRGGNSIILAFFSGLHSFRPLQGSVYACLARSSHVPPIYRNLQYWYCCSRLEREDYSTIILEIVRVAVLRVLGVQAS